MDSSTSLNSETMQNKSNYNRFMHAIDEKPPNDAHLDEHKSSLNFKNPVNDEVQINLALCHDVKYEAKDNIPGLKFTKDD